MSVGGRGPHLWHYGREIGVGESPTWSELVIEGTVFSDLCPGRSTLSSAELLEPRHDGRWQRSALLETHHPPAGRIRRGDDAFLDASSSALLAGWRDTD